MFNEQYRVRIIILMRLTSCSYAIIYHENTIVYFKPLDSRLFAIHYFFLYIQRKYNKNMVNFYFYLKIYKKSKHTFDRAI